MGIDVWVDRDRLAQAQRRRAKVESNSPQVENAPASDSTDSPRVTPTAPTKPKVQKPAAPAPQFHLCFSTWPRLSMVFDVPVSATSMPAPLGKFSSDIALAFGQRDAPVLSALKWPMVNSAHIDQSPEAAREVLQRKASRLSQKVLLFGDTAKSQLDGLVKGEVIELPAIDEVMASGAEKRRVWRLLLEALAPLGGNSP